MPRRWPLSTRRSLRSSRPSSRTWSIMKWEWAAWGWAWVYTDTASTEVPLQAIHRSDLLPPFEQAPSAGLPGLRRFLRVRIQSAFFAEGMGGQSGRAMRAAFAHVRVEAASFRMRSPFRPVLIDRCTRLDLYRNFTGP